MSAEKMTKKEFRDSNFSAALRKLPAQITMCEDAAICPWCGSAHKTITFGKNECHDCARAFYFGFPQWGESILGRPDSFVNFPWRELDEMGMNANLLEDWKPNELLLHYYKKSRELLASIEGKPDLATTETKGTA